MSKRWHQEHRRDPWRRRARREGYRTRSAYKLLQIQERFETIRPNDVVLDVGCHPGGWTQVAMGIVGEGGYVIGVDLLPTAPVGDAHLITGDIRDASVHAEIDTVLDGRKINSVVSDISPNLTGQYDTDQAISVDLVCMVFDFGLRHLRPGGSLITKIFQGPGLDAIVRAAKKRFSKVDRNSPLASRNASSEIYLICRNLKPAGKRPRESVRIVVENELEEDGIIQLGDDDSPTPKVGFRVRRKSD